MDPRREYPLVLGGLLGGGALALAVAQATWVVATTREVGYDTAFRGTEVAPAVVACALVALAGAVGVVATRGLVRRIVGGVLAVGGAVVAVVSLRVALDAASAVRDPLRAITGGATAAAPVVISVAWWWVVLAALGGVVVLVAGAAAVLHGSRWSVMAARYDAPAGSRRTKQPDAWAQLDRGEDPTVDTDLQQ
jgi:uncharacterized membrane protein (TIGR02234 family)